MYQEIERLKGGIILRNGLGPYHNLNCIIIPHPTKSFSLRIHRSGKGVRNH